MTATRTRLRRGAVAAVAAAAAILATPTITSATGGSQDVIVIDGEKVRIQGIDTPEAGEPCHDDAAAALRALVEDGGRVRVTRRDGTDRYGRTVASVSVGGVDVGKLMLSMGYARAAYDSRDGYARHQKERSYHTAERNTSCNPTSRTYAAPGQAPIDAEIGGTDVPFWTWAALAVVATDNGLNLDVDSFIAIHGDRNTARTAAATWLWFTVAEKNQRELEAAQAAAAQAAATQAAAASGTTSHGGSSSGSGSSTATSSGSPNNDGGARLPGGGCPPGGCTVPDGPRRTNNKPYDDGGARRSDGSCPPGGCR
jgi:endonuclease YncB( thermonuclease family)